MSSHHPKKTDIFNICIGGFYCYLLLLYQKGAKDRGNIPARRLTADKHAGQELKELRV